MNKLLASKKKSPASKGGRQPSFQHSLQFGVSLTAIHMGAIPSFILNPQITQVIKMFHFYRQTHPLMSIYLREHSS